MSNDEGEHLIYEFIWFVVTCAIHREEFCSPVTVAEARDVFEESFNSLVLVGWWLV